VICETCEMKGLFSRQTGHSVKFYIFRHKTQSKASVHISLNGNDAEINKA